MAMREDNIPLAYGDRVYAISPDFCLVREIEEELGSLPCLEEKFSRGSWKVSELVALTHMLLQASGETVDYIHLGNQMLRDGLGRYLTSIRSFLKMVLQSE